MAVNREYHRATSNNKENANKNVCALKVAQALGVADDVRCLHVMNDMKRAVQKKYSMRPVNSYVKSKTAGGARKKMPEIGAKYYVVWVPGHVLLMDAMGKTVVDTAPRKRDSRKLLGVWGVYPKK